MNVQEKDTDKKQTGKVMEAGAGYTIGNYLISGLTFLTIPLFSRLMSTADYGNYNTYIAFQNILYIIVGFALHASFKNAKYKYKERFEEYVSACILLAFVNLILWLVVFNILYFSYGGVINMSRLLINVLIMHSFGGALIQYFNSYVALDYQYKSFLKIAAANALGNILLSVVLILTVCRDTAYLGRTIGTAFPVILIAGYIMYYFWKKAPYKMNTSYWKYGVRYSLPIIPHGVSQILLTQFDRIMIKFMVGPAESGIYSYAYNIYSIIFVTTSSLDNVWGPWFYEKMEKKDFAAIRKQSTKYVFGMLLFCSIMLFVSPEIIKIMGTKEYWPAVYTVIPIVVGGYFTFLYTLPVQVEYYFEKTYFIAIGTVSAAVINFVLNWFSIGWFGYIAAAYSTLITYLLFFLFHYILAWKIGGRTYFSNISMILCSVLIIVAGAFSLLCLDYLLIRWIVAIIIGIFGVVWLIKELKINPFRGRRNL